MMASMDMFASPKRNAQGYVALENSPVSPPLQDITKLPWNCGNSTPLGTSETSPCQSLVWSPDTPPADNSKRGRPRADIISSLMIEGSRTPSNIRCKLCSRVFPREKSLQAHLRTHTGERPYVCDYPGCNKAFCQSGQLKTHQRLHTGEKPFACPAQGCSSRFTHANRHCPQHPNMSLKRLDGELLEMTENMEENNEAVKEWFKKHRERKLGKSTPQRKLMKRSLSKDIENEAKKHKQLSDHTVISSQRTSTLEHEDKWLGALALIELAQSNSHTLLQ